MNNINNTVPQGRITVFKANLDSFTQKFKPLPVVKKEMMKIGTITYLAYSWGKGDEYQVCISYEPNSMAAGQRV
jgi:hypothetical protein